MSDTLPLEPAVGYVRVSMAREEMVSPQLQRTAITERAARDGAHIPDGNWIEELDVSGRGFGRKGVQRAIQLVRDGTVRRVYVWKYSRFGRNATLVGVHVGEMEAAGGQLVSATEDVDARTAAGKFARGVMWQVDEFYSNVIGEQWKEAHARRHKNGLPHNGYPRFGYLYHRATTARSRCPLGCTAGACETGYVPDPVTREHAAGMFATYIGGTSVLKIAVGLNGLGLLTAAGKPWDQRAVRKYMDSGFAAGLLRVHNPACDCGRAVCKDKALIPGAHEAIISEEVWAEYQRQRDARRYLPPRVEAPVYPLAGLVKCGRCGSPLNAHGMVYKGTPKPGYLYQCSKYMRSRGCKGTWIARHRVEDVVLAWLAGFAEQIEKAAAAERGITRVRQTADLDRKRLEAQVARAERDLTELALQLARKLVPEDVYVRARDELLTTQETVKKALATLRPPPADATPLRVVAVGLIEEWPTFPPARQRALIGEMIARIDVQSHGKSGGSGRAAVSITATWGEVYLYSI